MVLPKVLAGVVLVGLWQLAVTLGLKPTYVIPAPADVWSDLWSELRAGHITQAIGNSLRRGAVGFGLSLIIGTALGLLIARVTVVRLGIGSLVAGLQTLPSVTWVPFGIVAFGLNESTILFVVVMGAVPSIAQGLVSALDTVPPLLTRVGRSMGAGRIALYRHVLLPAALPGYIAGLKQAWSFSWRSLMAAELITQSPELGLGLGQMLDNARSLSDMTLVVMSILVILAVGIAVDPQPAGAAAVHNQQVPQPVAKRDVVSVDQALGSLSLSALADLFRRRELSPVELLDWLIDATDRVDPLLNAVVQRLDGAARAQALESQARIARGEARPLEGLPVPIKDNVAVAGARMTLGSRMGPDFDMPLDAELVARLRAAGAIFPSKTNLPEFGTVPSTESELLGDCHNPWDLARTPGGSSGGAAALVAAGVVPAAHGNDGGGSLRIPAACCHLFTLKPTRGLVPRGPLDHDGFGLVVDGFVTRTVRDNAMLLDEVVGGALGEPYWVPRPAEAFVTAIERGPRRLRVAFSAAPPIPGMVVHPAHQKAVRDTAALLAGLGHDVVEHDPEIGRDGELVGLFLQLWCTVVAQGMELLAALGGDRGSVEAHNAALHAMSAAMTAPQFALVHAQIQDVGHRAMQLYATHDVLITPTTLEPPPPLGRIWAGRESDPLAPTANALVLAGYTALCNLTGQPAVQLPAALHEGLPVGVMAAARLGDDALLLQLSAQIEQARPWDAVKPPVHA